MNFQKVSWFLFFSKNEKVLALPSWAAPRILIVSRSPLQRWKDSSAFYPALRLRAKIVKWLIRVLVAFLPSLFCRPHRANASESEKREQVASFLYRRFPSFKQSAIAYSLFPSFFSKLGVIDKNAFGDDAALRGGLIATAKKYFSHTDRMVVLSGAASDLKQKLVAKVLNRRGICIGYLKFGEKPLARQRIETEVKILQALPQGCGPVFQGLEKTGEYICFAMSAVEGEMLPAALPEASEVSDQMSEVREYLEQLQVPEELFEIDKHPAILRIRQHLANGCERVANSFLDETLAPLRNRTWPVVIQHGDFTPWNVLRTSDVRCQRSEDSHTHTPIHLTPNTSLVAIDWEEGTTEGFPYFDFIYYILQTAYFMHHWSPKQTVFYVLNALTCNDFNEQVALSLIKLAAQDAWLVGEQGGLSGNPLQQFRFSIVNLKT